MLQARGVVTNSDEFHLYIYQSSDGLNFTKLAEPAYTPPSGLVRDASITHIGSLYYVAYTDAWSGKSFGIASSHDRVHWTFLETVTMPANTVDTWAPEWFLFSSFFDQYTRISWWFKHCHPSLISIREYPGGSNIVIPQMNSSSKREKDFWQPPSRRRDHW